MYADLQRRTSSHLNISEVFNAYQSLEDETPDFDSEYVVEWNETPIEKRQEFMMILCRTLYRYGVPAHRVQHLCLEAAHAIGLKRAAFVVSPDILIGSFGGDTENSRTIMYNPSLAYNISKAAEAESIAFRLRCKNISVLETMDRLKVLLAQGDGYNFPLWAYIILWGICGGASTVSIFGGNLADGVVGFVGGAVARSVAFVSENHVNFDKLLPLFASFSVSVVTLFFSYITPWDICYFPVALGAIQVMLPGFGLTVASYEILHRQWSSGIARMTMAMLSFILIGLGLQMGSQIAFWDKNYSIFNDCVPNTVPIFVRLGFIIVTAFSTDIIFGAKSTDLYILVTISSLTLCLQLYANPIVGSSYSAALASFCGGALSQIQRRFRNVESSGCNISLCTLMLLVPGGIGTRGVAAMAHAEFGSGVSFTVQTIELAMGLTFGIFLSSVFKPTPQQLFKVPYTLQDLNWVHTFNLDCQPL